MPVASPITYADTPSPARRGTDHAVDMAPVALMLGRMSAADDLPAALADLANCLQLWLGCDRVALGLADARGKTCRLEVVSGQTRLDRRSETVKTLERALDETSDNGGLAVWPAKDEELSTALTYRRVASTFGCFTVVGAPLVDLRGRCVGAVLAMGGPDLVDRTAAARRLTETAPLIAGHIDLARRAHASAAARLLREAWAALCHRSTKIVLGAAIGMSAILLIPTPFRLSCDCTIEPVVRRHVAAPFDGRLETTLVEPGDLVQRGDPLARMDEHELRWELTGLTAEHEQAKKRHDAALAARNAGAAQVTMLEMQQLEAKMRMLEGRREQLTIQSPLTGVVIRGDLKRSEGAPLSVGQTLFEVAPLDEMVVEIAIPEEEVTYFRPGAEVVLKLDAFAGQSWTGKLDRIHPRAEIRDDENVFIAEMRIDNFRDQLRPGMRGQAKLEGPRRTVGWIWLHRPWEALCKRLPI